MNTAFNSDKMYTYVRGYASGTHMKQTLKALTFARTKHEGQFRARNRMQLYSAESDLNISQS